MLLHNACAARLASTPSCPPAHPLASHSLAPVAAFPAPQFGDIERLDVVDEYSELSRKTARLFAHMSDTVVADFYFKIDDDVGGFTIPGLILRAPSLVHSMGPSVRC